MFEKWFKKDKDTSETSKVKKLKTKEGSVSSEWSAPTMEVDETSSKTPSSSRQDDPSRPGGKLVAESSLLGSGKLDKQEREKKLLSVLTPKQALDQKIVPQERPRESVLRVDEEALEAGARARSLLASMLQEGAVRVNISIPEGMGIRGEVAALFSHGHLDKAADVIIQHLNKEAGAASANVWYLLMDLYQIRDMQNHFEKTAKMFASVFKTSPPSWESLNANDESGEQIILGRQVLIVEGFPSQISEEKRKDFVMAARTHKMARLDLSRARLDEEDKKRVDDLAILLEVMIKLRKFRVKVILMGENQLVEYLRMAVQANEGIFGESIYWNTLLEFLQWRGQQESFETLAIAYAQRFGESAPEYEPDGMIATAPRERKEVVDIQEKKGCWILPEQVNDLVLNQMIEKMVQKNLMGESIDFSWANVKQASYEVAVELNQKMMQANIPAHQINFSNVNELFMALFEITGLTHMATIRQKKR